MSNSNPRRGNPTSSNPSRRSMVQLGWSGLALAGLTRGAGFGTQRSDGVLISLHLMGGNDGHNLIVPLDDIQYHAYARARGALAIPRRDLLPVKSGDYGFHPALIEVRDLYNRGVLGVMANAGTAKKPAGHNSESLAYLRGGYVLPSFAARHAGLDIHSEAGFVNASHGVTMAPLDGFGLSASHRQELQSAQIPYNRFPATPLGRALAQVAALLPSTRGRRILFSIPMCGFDTHFNQMARQQSLFRELSEAMAAARRAAEDSGHANRVILFTDSEFGRSLRPNRHGGSDHGWGNHHLVLGGSVQGGEIHGSFPDLTRLDADGLVEPTMQMDEYFATLAGWSGLSPAQVAKAIPGVEGNRLGGLLS